MIRVGARALVVLAGLPGAGKSTTLDRLLPTSDMVVLDPEQVQRCVSAALGTRVPYRTYRGVVHLVHRIRIVRACLGFDGPVVVHEPSTRPTTRALLVLSGFVTRRPRVLVYLHVDPAVALAGQYERGRLVGMRSFARHVRRAGRLSRALRAGRLPRGWVEAHVLTRDDLAGGLRVEVQ